MRRLALHLALAVVLTLVVTILPGGQGSFAQEVLDQPIVPAFVPGQLIVRFKPGITPEEIEAFYSEYGLTEMDDLDRAPVAEPQALKLAFVPVEVTQALIDTLERDARVVFAEPNYILQIAQNVPDDPDFDKLWGFNNTGQTGGVPGADVSLLDGWGVETGSDDVVVVVIDTGVDYTHEDLGPNMWVNEAECPDGYGECEADGVDDDDNGYVDDFYGINAITNSGDPMDDYGHGTHVAGTIGAQGDNGLGVSGINQDVSIIACKFLSASGGGTVADAIKCFNYVSQLKNEQDVNIVATNNSWSGGAPSEALEDAMSGPEQPLHICAAGNANTDIPSYPAAYDLPNIVSVAATDASDLYADFSNYGPTVDLAAPGAAIYSTVPTGSCALCDPSGYALVSGTSMATPHVAGAVALIAAQYPALDRDQIVQRIVTGVDPLADTTKSTITNGRLNVFNTLEEDETPPAAVGDLAITTLLLTQVELTWTATGDDGTDGQANASDVRYSTTPITPENWESATQATGEPVPQQPGSTETFVVSGLEPDTAYYFAMRVIDNVGNASPLSNIVIGKTSAGSIVFEDDMESGENDWTSAGTNSLWHLSERRSNSPTHAWYFGDEDSGTYDTGETVSGFLTSPPIDLTTNDDVLLTFHEWSETESSSTFDRTRVQLSLDGGNTWETVFESHGTNGDWVKRDVSLTQYIGDSSTIHVRYWFDSIDNRFNAFEGWFIDDVSVLVAEPSVPGAGPTQPNLLMADGNIGLSHPNPVTGDEVIVSAVVINNGGEVANNVSVQFMDAGGDSPVPIEGPQTLTSVPVGGSATAQITLDTTDMVGSQTIQVVVDPFNLITEGNESDNQASRTFTVTMPAMPNLVIDTSNIAFNPAEPQPGDQVTVHAVVRNDGEVAAENVAVQFLDVTESSAIVLIGETQSIDMLAPGGTAAVEVTYDTSNLSGDREIRVVLDPQNAIRESDEDDNEATAEVSLATLPQPNLSLTSSNVGFDPETPSTGDMVTVVATVFNDGELAAHNVVVQFVDATSSSSQTPIGEPQTIDVIPPGGSGLAQVTYSTAGMAGDRKVKITVDPYNFIAESRETDNESTATLSITPPPIANLTVLAENIGFDPQAPVEGEDVTVRAVIQNIGRAPAEGIMVQFFDTTAGATLPIGEHQVIASLAPGGSAQVSVAYSTTGRSGTRQIQVVVDPNNFVVEANEEDNEATQALTVADQPAPNLVMMATNITFDPPMPTAGDVVSITAVVVNNGAVPAHRVLVQFIDVTNGAFDPIGLEQTIETVPPGGSATAHISYDTTGLSGNRRIQVLVDSNNLIAEEDENDNEATASLSVSANQLANLVVRNSGIGFNPQQPTVGEDVTVAVVIQNMGAAAAENVEVQLLDITDGEPAPVGEVTTIARIEPGGAEVIQMTYPSDTTADAGDHILRVVVDPNNFIVETDETDNRTSVTLTLTAAYKPNLVVMSGNLGFLPPAPVEGETVTLAVTILNTGAATAEDVLVQFVDVTDGAAEPIDAKQTITEIPAGSSATAQVTYDTRDKVGERRIRVVADPHAIIDETNESDNEAVAVLRVAAEALPNLTALPENIGFSTSTPAPGEPVVVTATVLNTGRAVAENVVVQFMDATSGAGTPIGTSIVISTIPPGGAELAQITYETRGRFGERTLQVVVDPNNLIVESDENDNRAMASIEIATPPVANLVLRSTQIGFDPPEIGTEGTAIIYATVRNDGGLAVGDVVVQFLDVTDGGSAAIGEPQVIPGIGPGASGMVQVTYNIPPGSGDRRIQVVVDPNNTIFESSESDNQATATLPRSKSSQANLVLTTDNVTFSGSPTAGDSVTIRAVVLNKGAADAENVVVQFSDTTDGSTPIGPQQVIPSIAAGSSAAVEVTYDTTGASGDRSIRVAVDPNNFIPESSETDNTATVTLEVLGPDRSNLIVTSTNINFDPIAPTSGDVVIVRAVILNHGVREARDVVVLFSDVTDGAQQPIGTPQSVARIPAGGAATVQVAYSTAGMQGERSLQVTADPNNFILETNENDNQAAKPLVIGAPPAPNLVMLSSNIEFMPSQPQDGNLVTIQATVLNNGAEGTIDIVVRIEDVTDPATPVLIGKQRLIDALAPEESAAVQVTYDSTGKAGDRMIRVTADPEDTIAESDEKDNQATAIMQVAPPPAPNLVVTESNVRFTPSAPKTGDEVTISVTVLNEGQRNASRVEVQVYDTTNGSPVPIGDIQTIGGIPAGGSGIAEVTYDTTGKEGERTIQVVVDPSDLVDELSEDDNQVEVELTVSPPSDEPDEQPNLALTDDDITYAPEQPTPGEPVTLTVNLLNDGAVEAEDVVVRVMDVTDDEPVQVGDDQTIDTIDVGETLSVTVVYDTTDLTGMRELEVTVDPDDDISETNEDDNTGTITIPLGGGNGGSPGDGDQGNGDDPGNGAPPEDGDEPSDGDEPASETTSLEVPRDGDADTGISVQVAEDNIRRANDPDVTQ